MSDRPLIGDSLAILKFFGLVAYENNFWRQLKRRILITVLAISYIDVLLCTFVKWNQPDSIENVLMSFAFTQIVLKLASYNSQYVLITLRKMENFDPLNNDDLKQGPRYGEIFSTIKSFLKLFVIFVLLGTLLFSLKPLITFKKQLPFGSVIFWSNESPVYEMGYLYELVVTVLLLPVQIGFDVLYISIIVNIVYEFKLLKISFAQMPINENPQSDEYTLERLGKLISHHNIILNCTRALRQTFYMPFLCIFVFNMLGIGFCLLCIIANGFFQNIAVSLVYTVFCIYYVAQLFLYCAPGTILIFESTEVSDVIFNTDWWIKTQPELRKAYIRILQRANKPVLLSAGGMMNVTLESFNAVVKSALSFFTCVQAMYRKNA